MTEALCAYSVFVCHIWSFPHPLPTFSLFVFHFRFRLFTFQPPLQRASLAKAVWKLFASLEKGGGLPQASRRDFLKKAFQKKVHYFLIPQSTHFVRSQLPLQGSLNNPSVCSRCSQPAPDGSPSPLSLRDISPHCGESPNLREAE